VKTSILKLIIKLLAVALVVLAVVVGKQNRQLAQMREQVRALEHEQETLSQQIQQSSREHDDVTRRLTIVQEENERLRRETADAPRLRNEVAQLRNDSQELARLKEAGANAGGDPTEAEMKSWLARVRQLKQRLEKTPDARIPELQFVTENDWLNVARGKLETDDDYRRALAGLRDAGESKFYKMAVPALYEYMKANNGQFSTDLSQLRPYFGSPVDDAILQRWEIVPSDTLPDWKVVGDWVITQSAPIDPEYDRRLGFSVSGSHVSDWPRKPE
jgi:uncharacterized protein YoxC